MPWKVCYVFRINPFCSQITSDRSKQYVCQFSEESVEYWRFWKPISIFHKFNYITSITYKIVKISKWRWPLTFIWPWPWVWPLTLTIWRNIFFPKIYDFFKVTWRKNVTSYVKTEDRLQKRNSIRNVMQLTRSLYHFRFKRYGPLCDFHKSGDLDLDFYPISKKINLEGPWTRLHQLSKYQYDRSTGVACTSRTDGQTDRQTDKQTDRQTVVTNILCKNLRFCKVTNRGDQYTLQKSTILQSNKPRWPIYFAKIYDFAK